MESEACSTNLCAVTDNHDCLCVPGHTVLKGTSLLLKMRRGPHPREPDRTGAGAVGTQGAAGVQAGAETFRREQQEGLSASSPTALGVPKTRAHGCVSALRVAGGRPCVITASQPVPLHDGLQASWGEVSSLRLPGASPVFPDHLGALRTGGGRAALRHGSRAGKQGIHCSKRRAGARREGHQKGETGKQELGPQIQKKPPEGLKSRSKTTKKKALYSQ